jgi:hypothetical protein
LKREKILENQNISTLEDEDNALFETLESGYPLAQCNVADGNPHFI